MLIHLASLLWMDIFKFCRNRSIANTTFINISNYCNMKSYVRNTESRRFKFGQFNYFYKIIYEIVTDVCNCRYYNSFTNTSKVFYLHYVAWLLFPMNFLWCYIKLIFSTYSKTRWACLYKESICLIYLHIMQNLLSL